MSTTQMIKSDVSEALHLFEVMGKYNVPCSLELKLDGLCDPFVGISTQPVKAEYLETFDGEGRGDSLIVHLGGSEFCFELNLSVSKHITDCQITLCIVSDKYAAWFSSDVILPEGIEDAKDYKEAEDYHGEPRDITMDVTKQENELIEFVRTLDFGDTINATAALYSEAEKVRGTRNASRPELTVEFIECARRLDELSKLIAMANDDYRSEISIMEKD
ncbi:hypothetical protein [Paenibacillus antarcticus]|uniref:Uncharacterized protein n=1 Tax=Paenibacillus antarcticus TaxID=253703 RepID=A0A168PAL2_9BACL|nr:hypothetical protein [Paenibacillus antarcticus]OAB46569.1 hypothetical protein PBAT_11175 [Paenibacillus antarcticus]